MTDPIKYIFYPSARYLIVRIGQEELRVHNVDYSRVSKSVADLAMKFPNIEVCVK